MSKIKSFCFIIFRYHTYHHTPVIGEQLGCIHEPSNRYDVNAVLVKSHEGATIVHVPRNICGIKSTGIRVQHILTRTVCIYTGRLIHEGHIRGGDVKLPFIYLLYYVNSDALQRVGLHIKEYIPDDCLFL